jgi:nucleotide-binding universal stress UspA family protein
MFDKVAWATDGSEAADQALPFVRKLLGEGHGEVVVIHVAEHTLPHKGAGEGGGLPVNPDEDELRDKINRQVSELSDAGVRATLHVVSTRVGGAAHAIADAAREEKADVILVATRGHTALAGLVLGSVTQRLLHVAPCPVFAVPRTSHSA